MLMVKYLLLILFIIQFRLIGQDNNFVKIPLPDSRDRNFNMKSLKERLNDNKKIKSFR